MPLKIRREAGWVVSASRGRASPKNLVDFVFPWNFHRVLLDQPLLVIVPTIGILFRASVIIMTGNSDV